ncbi:MAG: rod shape-determining protein RodA [Muribaculaceae bacterium]|nr:rod shape-determining protein RodA [Bacteroides sp.]MDE7473838.1 rod shape-determining protein RodA [Muribaculaceae bacterium]
MNYRNQESPLKGIDWPTVIIYMLLVVAGAISIYAASYDFDNASIFDYSEFSGKQLRWIGLSFVLGLGLLLIDARMYETYAYPIYVAVMILLLITIFIAPNIKGSHSWIVIGSMSIQPAEFAKFATALALAKLFSGYNFSLNASTGNYMKALAIIFLPVGLILAQNETGSALVYLGLFFVLYREGMSGLVLLSAILAIAIFVISVKFTETMIVGIPSGQFTVYIIVMVTMVTMLALYSKTADVARNVALGFTGCGLIVTVLELCGIDVPGQYVFPGMIGAACLYCLFETMRLRVMKITAAIGAAIIAVAFMFSVNYVFTSVLKPHQQMRIKVALGIEDDILKAGYNVNQSKIAIGSGGFAGKGFLKGTQTKLKYVPEQHTDFIFCTIGEEEGFIGTSLTMMLFVILILRVIVIAERQPTTFGRVFAYCVASYFIVHFCINIGMVIGLCPVIGIPLPFFSYGGSSLWGFTFLLFILLRIDASRRSHH